MFRRNSFFLLCTSLSCLPGVQANAGGCCDWLFGRTSTPYVVGYTPYVVGYAPYASYNYALNGPVTAPYAAGYPAVATSVVPVGGTYQAQMQTYDNPSVYTGQPVILNQGQTQTAYSLPMTTGTAAVASNSPVYSANYGSYYGANYGGATLFGSAPAAVPLAESFRGPATTGNPFYGTGNIYPSANPATAYQSNYPPVTVAGSPAVTSVPTGSPASVYPAAPIAPVFAETAQPPVGGLGRFFGSALGTDYRSSYYRAPITYYRPITSIDPVSGKTVTVQQPCTSYVQQLQRTPYTSLQPGLIAPTATPVGAPVMLDGSQCPTASAAAPMGYAAAPTASAPMGYAAAPTASAPMGYAAAPTASAPMGYAAAPTASAPMGYAAAPTASTPMGYAAAPTGGYPTAISPFDSQSPNSQVGQVGGYTTPNDRFVVPIPSTQEPGYYPQPGGLNTSPLTGNGADDSAPVDQPRLESARPSSDEDWWRDDSTGSDQAPYQESKDDESAKPSSFLERIEYGDRTAANDLHPNDAVKQAQAYSTARPIEAPAGFANTFDRAATEPVTPVNGHDLVAPPLPPPARPASTNDGESYSASVRVSVPVREATQRIIVDSHASSSALKPLQPKRDNTWYSAK